MADDYHVKKRRTERHYKAAREFLASLLAGRTCARCPENHPACLQWHHRDPSSKKIAIGSIKILNADVRARVLAEIEKCDLLCANCHRKEEWRMRQQPGYRHNYKDRQPVPEQLLPLFEGQQ